MSQAQRVSISRIPKRAAPIEAPRSLLARGGADIALGFVAAVDGTAAPVEPSARTMFAPRGVCVAADRSLWVADTGHHRLLGWTRVPTADNEAADYVIGQPTFGHEGRNAKGTPGPSTLNVPTGIAACGGALAVADAWNHRVLLWHEIPRRDNQPADLVLGQRDFSAVEPNRGADAPTAESLFWPFGVAWDGQRLFVADSGNRRVLAWNGLPRRPGQLADLVLGQESFNCRNENAGGVPSRASMRWPHSIAFLGSRVCVADAGNSRVLIWNECPTRNGAACETILGQRSPEAVDHNQGEYWPGAASLNMPYAVATTGEWLMVADTANSRLVGWHASDIAGSGVAARCLAGQPDWQSKGDNAWRTAARDNFCWPYGLGLHGDQLLVADAGNNRVLLWRLADEVRA